MLVNGDGPAALAADLLATYIYDRLRGKAAVEDTFAARIDTLGGRMEEARRGPAAHLAERKARLAPLSHPREQYAGIYENARSGRMEWRVVANGLEVRMGVAQSRAEVYDESSFGRVRIAARSSCGSGIRSASDAGNQLADAANGATRRAQPGGNPESDVRTHGTG